MIIVLIIVFAAGTCFGLLIGGMLASGKFEDLIRENYYLYQQIEQLQKEYKNVN